MSNTQDFFSSATQAILDKVQKGQTISEAVNLPEEPEEPKQVHKIVKPEDSNWDKVFPKVSSHVLKITTYNPEDWSPEIRGFIPDKKKFANYIPDAGNLFDFAVGVEMNEKIFLSGPPETGKTSLGEYFCAMTCRPYVRFQGHGALDVRSLLGSMTLVNGELKWVDGVFTTACRHGALIMFDEVDGCPPEIEMALRWLLEEDGKLLLSDKHGDLNDKVVKPDERFRLVASANTKGLGDVRGLMNGTNPMSGATLRRYHTFIEVKYLSKAIERGVLKNMLKSKGYNIGKKEIEQHIGVAELVRNMYDTSQVSHTIGVQFLSKIIEKSIIYSSPTEGWKRMLVSRMSEDEGRAVVNCVTTVFGK